MVNIIPVSSTINGLGPVGGGPNIAAPGSVASKGFADFFREAVENVESLDAVKRQDAYDLAVGEADNLAEIAANAAKAEVAVQLMVQMRNKLLDSYSEIMRISI